ncbi:hypothetical protein J27TS7_31700 [Paenibacillus dendritiformis]|nr:hypothetical protein J27TS7_31700 [Paenibacillus dendritiformis]
MAPTVPPTKEMSSNCIVVMIMSSDAPFAPYHLKMSHKMPRNADPPLFSMPKKPPAAGRKPERREQLGIG